MKTAHNVTLPGVSAAQSQENAVKRDSGGRTESSCPVTYSSSRPFGLLVSYLDSCTYLIGGIAYHDTLATFSYDDRARMTRDSRGDKRFGCNCLGLAEKSHAGIRFRRVSARKNGGG